jgi:hypothetical protein
MSPWIRFILRHVDLDGRGLFSGAVVLEAARKAWGDRALQDWHVVMRMSR